MKRILCLFTTVVLIFSMASYGENTGEETMITIVHTNDIHGQLITDEESIGGSVLSEIVKEIRSDNKNVLLVDAGDTFHGHIIANAFKGQSVVDAMNLIQYDVMTAGNHDFNYGVEHLKLLSSKINFPLISSNIDTVNGKSLFPKTYIKEIDGVVIGFFGLTSLETPYKTHPRNVEGVNFVDPIARARESVDFLEDQVDIIVCIGHLGEDESTEITSKDVIASVSGIDLFIDGHSHTAKPLGERIGDTLLVQTGAYSSSIGVVDIVYGSDGSVDLASRLIDKESVKDYRGDSEMDSLISEYNEQLNVKLKEVVGYTEYELDGVREHVRTRETNLGNYITDAMRQVGNADVALKSGGSIRSSIDIGDVTLEELISVLPFGGTVVTLEVTGEQIKAALEHGLSKYPDINGAFPQVSGVRYLFDPEQPAGKRVTQLYINDKPLELNAKYTLATDDFIAAGGDAYTMFVNAKQIRESGGMVDSVIEHFKNVKPSNSKMTRMQFVQKKPMTYTILNGDVLWKIAQKYNTTWEELAQYNQLKNPHLIITGHKLLIPQH